MIFVWATDSVVKRFIKQNTPIYNLFCSYALTLSCTLFFSNGCKKYVLEINLKFQHSAVNILGQVKYLS
jgi:hypothetical protein